MSYFTTENEALHLAASRDGHRFAALNGGAPVLRSTVGTKTLRDPFVGPGPDSGFHLLATDGWASRSIVHSVSANLRDWAPPELIPVMDEVPGAYNAWAPEFFYDPDRECYQLIWSSVVEPAGTDADRNWRDTAQDHRIWGCVTKDFRSYSPAELFFDPGFPVIDATVARDGDRFLMAFKDERGVNELTTSYKHILLTTFRKPGGAFEPSFGPVSPGPWRGRPFSAATPNGSSSSTTSLRAAMAPYPAGTACRGRLPRSRSRQARATHRSSHSLQAHR